VLPNTPLGKPCLRTALGQDMAAQYRPNGEVELISPRKKNICDLPPPK